MGPLSELSVCLSVCDGVLWPNGWMDQDVSWYGGRPRPGHIVLDGDPAPPPRKGLSSPHFSAHVCCGQTVAHLGNCRALVYYMILLSSVTSIIPPAGVRSVKVFLENKFGLLKVVISLYM